MQRARVRALQRTLIHTPSRPQPTSGLDSAAAAKIMHFLKVTAKQTNIPILCTIHQPSASVYEGFDDVLVLAAGRVAYFGAAAQMGRPDQPPSRWAEIARGEPRLSEIVGSHLERLGHPLPSTANPADSTMLDLVHDLSRVE